MRLTGMSYSQIKQELGVSKSTLSVWLQEYPLSEERIRELRDFSVQRIERYRETCARRRQARLRAVHARVAEDIGTLSAREVLLCGLFLYWGEGSKTRNTLVSVSNTDPGVLLFFIRWVVALGAPREKLRVRLHVYADMDPAAEMRYWSRTLGLPLSAFRKPYMKSSNRLSLTYKQPFSHGTCNVIYGNRDISEYVHEAMDVLRAQSLPTEGKCDSMDGRL